LEYFLAELLHQLFDMFFFVFLYGQKLQLVLFIWNLAQFPSKRARIHLEDFFVILGWDFGL